MQPPSFKKRKLSPPPSSFKDQAYSRLDWQSSIEGTGTDGGVEAYHGGRKIVGRKRNAITSLANATYNSDMFKLRIDELLAKMRPNCGRNTVEAENALRKLKSIIEQIPDREAIPISQAEREQYDSHKIRIPFPKPQPDKEAKYTLAYARPSNINVVGSYARQTAIRVGDPLEIDLAVTMPPHIFQEKDYLNYRYFHKRAYYLVCIATAIREAREVDFDMIFTYHNDSHLQPTIVVAPRKDMASEPDYSIRIVLAADETLFPLSKTLPNKNCIRAKKDHIPHHGRCSDLSTPFYNASLRSECSSLAYLKYLHEASLQSAGFSDACRLGVLWLRQRGFRANGGFGPFEWACTIALLMQGGRPKGKPVLSKDYSSYQLFKATLQYLSYSDLIAMPLFIHSSALDFIDHNQPMIFDGVRGMNILYKMTLWSYATLRHEATRSVNLLSDPLSDHFEGCFITNVDQPFQRFDYVMRLSLTEMRRPTSQSEDAIADELKLCFQLYRALNIGLGDRARLVHLQPPPKPPWFSAATEQAAEDRSQVQVGILVDPEQVNRTVDRGPSAEEKEAAVTFRNFWGNKAELRRFKDGSILESLIWSTSDPTKSVLKQIVTHIIQRHVRKNAADEIRFAGDAFDHLLLTQALPSSDTSTLYQPMMDAFDDLEKKIRNLNDFPLQIRQISPADSKLRFASTIVPTLSAERCQMEPADVHIQFEGSSRWPSDIAAVQRTKIAFLLKLGELLLEEPTEVLTAQLGLENLCHRLHNTAFLEVLFSSGALFRLRIHHERELSILERNLIGSTQATASREETAFALSTYKRSFIQASVHTQAVRTLATRFPLLSLCMRLMKRWRDSHLLSNHLSDELIEIVTIRSFAHPYPWSIPGSVMTAFVRTLTFVSKWDWHSEPLIVDFNGEMSSQDIDAIKMRFEAWRKIDPAMNRIAIFAASSIETSGISWTELGPSKVVAARFTSLAKAACNVLKEQSTTIEPRALFLPSMEEYDFVIHFQPNLSNAVDSREKHSAPKNLQTRPNTNVLGVSHDPIHLFVDELVAIYGSHVLFFENKNDRSLIAGLWNPQTGPRPWKVNLQYSTVPFMQSASEDVQISINKDATLHDIARLGGDLISRIEIKP